jgi:arylsulfatase A-like enzyme
LRLAKLRSGKENLNAVELCGAAALENFQGRSWRKLVNDGDTAWRTAWFYEYNYEKQFPYTPNVRGIRTDEWKFVRYPHGDDSPDRHVPELYHLASDPDELHNLALNLAHSATRIRLEEQLAALMGIKSALPDQKIR